MESNLERINKELDEVSLEYKKLEVMELDAELELTRKESELLTSDIIDGKNEATRKAQLNQLTVEEKNKVYEVKKALINLQYRLDSLERLWYIEKLKYKEKEPLH